VLTAEEKRFIKSWEEQREGGKFKYFALYLFAGTFVGSIVLSFLSVMFNWGLFPGNLVVIIGGSLLLISVLTMASWSKNEKRFKRIIQREIKQGMEHDAAR
jgi:hypothetical protein